MRHLDDAVLEEHRQREYQEKTAGLYDRVLFSQGASAMMRMTRV